VIIVLWLITYSHTETVKFGGEHFSCLEVTK